MTFVRAAIVTGVNTYVVLLRPGHPLVRAQTASHRDWFEPVDESVEQEHVTWGESNQVTSARPARINRGCITQSSHAVDGSNKMRVASEHRNDGVMNVNSNK